MSAGKPTLALIGGTGDLGTGLAMRWVAAGYAVIIGSREAAKAAQAAQRLAPPAGAPAPRGLANAEAAAAADVVVITVPFASHDAISRRSPVGREARSSSTRPFRSCRRKSRACSCRPVRRRCCAAGARRGRARNLGVSATCRALKLQKGEPIDCDVLVFGDKPEDREVAIRLAEAAGLRALHAGPLANSTAAEALTSVLIGINRNYRVDGAGIRITGIAST
jgi:NADPH-dependent F420 reductase